MPLTKEEKIQLVAKTCKNINELDPAELPPLAYHLFALCNTASLIIIPIISFHKYFQKHYYKKLLEDLDSEHTNFDSIGIIYIFFF